MGLGDQLEVVGENPFSILIVPLSSYPVISCLRCSMPPCALGTKPMLLGKQAPVSHASWSEWLECPCSPSFLSRPANSDASFNSQVERHSRKFCCVLAAIIALATPTAVAAEVSVPSTDGGRVPGLTDHSLPGSLQELRILVLN